MNKFLASISYEGLLEWIKEIGESKFRAKQIFEWIYKHRVLSPEKMVNIPASLREKIADEFFCNSSSVVSRSEVGEQTNKLLIELYDGEQIEAVLIPSTDRVTFCLSTQVGCPVRCTFCASGVNGLVRNLKSGEIIEQFFIACKENNGLPDNIVFMGIGEGLLNFENLVDSLNILTDESYIGLSSRRVTVSTSGWVPGIVKLAELERPWNLAISLHATDDKTRSELIPDKFRCSLSDIIDAAINYRAKSNRMVTFEYTLIEGVNDSIENAEKLVNIARKCRAKVNIIPYNQTDNQYRRPEKHVIEQFYQKLLTNNIQVSMRIEKGSNIAAACGQLRISHKNESSLK